MADITVPADIIVEIGRIGLWIQTLGIVVILAIIYWGVTMYFNRKRRKLLEDIDLRVKRIESKLDSLGKRR